MLSLFPNNVNVGLDSHQSTIIIFEGQYGKPIAMLDASYITELRTAAVSALATEYLARDDSEGLVLTIIGAGPQAKSHIKAMLNVRKVKKIYIYNRTLNKAEQLASETETKFNISATASESLEFVVRQADIICTVTGSKDPIIKSEWVKEGTHINAIGASQATTRELDSELVHRSLFYGDYEESIMSESGDFLIPLQEGVIQKSDLKGDLTGIVTQNVPLRNSDKDITIFKNLGLAAEDIACAVHIFKNYQSRESYKST